MLMTVLLYDLRKLVGRVNDDDSSGSSIYVCVRGKETKHDTHYRHVKQLMLCRKYRWHRSRWEKNNNLQITMIYVNEQLNIY
jgi:hypothetical protein